MIFKITENTIDNILSLNSIDILLVSIGYENRASHLANLLSNCSIKKRICIELVENCNLEQKSILEEFNFSFIKIEGLIDVLNNIKGNVIIDYSVMMKNLYAEIIKFFANTEKEIKYEINFCYTHAVYKEITDNFSFVKTIEPILSTENKLIDRYRGKKLIVSLGYERLSVIGIIENLEINYDDVIVLINKQTYDENFYHECIKKNKNFLDSIDKSQIIELDFFNFNQTISILDSLFFRLRMDNAQVILAPMSVKSFSLLSMIHSLEYDNVLFYNVTSVNENIGDIKYPDIKRSPHIYKLSKVNTENYKVV